MNDFDIPLRLSNTVTKVIGRDKLEAIEISDVDANLKPIKGTEKIIECDTLLLSIGLYPFNALLKQAGCEVNPRTKGSKVNQNLETSIKGIYSCGNVLHVHDLVDFVTLEGEKAGKCAAYDLIHHHKHVEKRIVVDAKENLKINNISNVKFICGDATKEINKIKEKVDVVIVDPPRKGIDRKAIAIMKKLSMCVMKNITWLSRLI